MSEKSVEILCIGREILDGRVIDTNSTSIALEIAKVGLRPQYAQKVDDDPERMLESFRLAKSRAEIVFVCGGLGPTSDDRTLDVFAEYITHEMVEYPNARKLLETYLKERGRPMNEAQLKQTRFPEGGKILTNPFGTACGFEIDWQGTTWFFLPGPPRELIPMMEKEILPKFTGGKPSRGRSWITQFTAESDLQLKLNKIISRIPKEWDLSFQARFPEVAIGLHAPSNSDSGSFENFQLEIRNALTGIFWHEGDHSRFTIEEKVIELLKTLNCKIVTVESCTGGQIAHRLTDVSGSADAFLGSWVTYANEAKIQVGVSPETIKKHGAVSEAVAKEMASAGLKQAKSLWKGPERILAVSVTGIAGPGGGTAEKPVGLCFVALADSDSSEVQSLKIDGPSLAERSRNRRYFSQKAFELVLKRLTNS